MKPEDEKQPTENVDNVSRTHENLTEEFSIDEVADFVAGPDEIPGAPDIPEPRKEKEV